MFGSVIAAELRQSFSNMNGILKSKLVFWWFLNIGIVTEQNTFA